MSTTFSRSLRSLDLDSFRHSNLALLTVMAFILAWLGWLFLARITLYETSDTARLEVESAVHPVAVQFGGRVVKTHLELGKEVKAGDILVELDTEEHRLHLEEQRSQLAGLQNQLVALRNEVSAQERAYQQEQAAAPTALQEANARQLEAETAANLAEKEAERMQELFKRGLISEVEFRRAEANATRSRAAAEALRLTASRLQSEQKTKASDQQAQLERLNREVALLEGQIATTEKSIEREQLEIQEQDIRAPVSGRIGEISELRAGAVVRPGDKLATIVPTGEFRIVANFIPGTALGRVASEQPARMRLDAYPWTQFGTLPAKVANVANEPTAGKIRIELAVQPRKNSAIVLQHGLTGSVEVEVDRVSPASMVLRSVVKLLNASKKESSNDG
jgi:membrane fusion protein (multidrug efflux system)